MNTNSILTTNYDTKFGKVEHCTWLPWVGSNFPQRPATKKLLLVGESHYALADNAEQLAAIRKSHFANPTYTREVVEEVCVNRKWGNRTLDAIPKLLFKTTEIDRPRFWSDIAFYNFVQTLPHYNQKGQPERPSRDDFVQGWKVFADVVRTIQPSHCLFIGVTAANSFNYSMTGQNLSFENVSCAPTVAGVRPRVAKLEIAGTTTKLIFVHHLCRCKALSQWHDYLQNQHADVMNALGAESYAINRNA